jgi:hypothetical protein
MLVELSCPCCATTFTAPPGITSDEVMHRMFDGGPAYALGDGETFEDMIFTTLMEQGEIRCPTCGEPVSVSEESLGKMAMEVLERW